MRMQRAVAIAVVSAALTTSAVFATAPAAVATPVVSAAITTSAVFATAPAAVATPVAAAPVADSGSSTGSVYLNDAIQFLVCLLKGEFVGSKYPLC